MEIFVSGNIVEMQYFGHMVTSDELTACHRCLNDHRPRFGRDEGVSADALTMIDGILAGDRRGIGDMP